MKLNVKTTFTVTTEDLGIYANPPLTFEAIGNIPNGLRRQLREWHQAGYPVEQAVEFVPKMFISIQNGTAAYPLNTQQAAAELESELGSAFVANLVESYWQYEFDYYEKKALSSGDSSKVSDGIVVTEQLPLEESPEL